MIFMQLSLFDLIPQPPATPHPLDLAMPADLSGWMLLQDAEGYYCLYTKEKIKDGYLRTAHSLSKTAAINEAHTYSIIYELYPIPILWLNDPGPFWPHAWRLLEIAHEARIGKARGHDQLCAILYHAKRG